MKLKEGWYWVQPKDLKQPIPCYYIPEYDEWVKDVLVGDYLDVETDKNFLLLKL